MNNSALSFPIKYKIGLDILSQNKYIKYKDRNLIPNFPVTQADIMAAEDIFGTNLISLKVMTVCKKLHSLRPIIQHIPIKIMESYMDVTLSSYIMYVNNIIF